ncbi:methyltransferase FkbM family [Anaeromyxobacter dehalogenans 2CP-1]|uniref:Methyltransferase FkbM family n=1 Tax=Anaeromyxobacter dehalogenans (strain ATCC BAA-258 / DSM 21875 / 2CP-1) TaxID=455488 RepID=B8JH65_ANAD2|nr:FkbM family methyltransferase [Anaeromyxobacter dehalogenans]ACL64767.1 methyltransferase FkbM family [Anaeromyxobacter dehalogenans 2CP-1]
MRIGVVFSTLPREDTTGVHVLRALHEIGCDAFHHEPLRRTPGGGVELVGYEALPSADLYLQVDDDLAYPGPVGLGAPSAYYCIDTHRLGAPLAGGTLLRPEKARDFDHVFSAQRDGVDLLARRGIAARWLPLAYDPARLAPDPAQPKQIDWCFLGTPLGDRPRICRDLARRFPSCVFGQAYGEAALRIYQQSRIILNLPVGNDVNMRFFEALGAGGLLIGGAVHNGEDELVDGLVRFDDPAELPALVERWLADAEGRAVLAAEQQRAVAGRHTYAQRMRQLLAGIEAGPLARPRPAPASPAEDAAALVSDAVARLEAGSPADALRLADRAAQLDGARPQAHRARALALAGLGRPADAAAALLRELELSPASGEAFRTFVGMLDRAAAGGGMPGAAFTRAFLRVLDLASEAPAGDAGPSLEAAAHAAAAVLGRHAEFERAWAALADADSRRWMLELCAHRALGPGRVPVRFDADRARSLEEDVEARMLRERGAVPASATRGGSQAFQGWRLDRYDLRPAGLPLELLSTAEYVVATFFLRQYQLDRAGVRVAPAEGDVVVDGGGCFGETALHFAHQVGPAGRVLSFEFLPAHLEVFRANLALNPALAGRVEIVPEALWDRSGEEIPFTEHGPATHLGAAPGAGAAAARTRSVDDLVEARGLPRVDFLKLDVEGAELAALRGAERTIRRHRPRLAIAAYHRPEDLGALPAWIDALGLGYRIYLDHFTPGAWETIAFAAPATA